VLSQNHHAVERLLTRPTSCPGQSATARRALGAYVAALQDAPEHAPHNPGPGVSPNANAALRRSLLYHAGLVFPDGQQGGARQASSDEPLQPASCLPWTVPGQEREVARARSVHRACRGSDRLAPDGHLTPTPSRCGARARSCAERQPPEAAHMPVGERFASAPHRILWATRQGSTAVMME
jgi:hypothetical protein